MKSNDFKINILSYIPNELLNSVCQLLDMSSQHTFGLVSRDMMIVARSFNSKVESLKDAIIHGHIDIVTWLVPNTDFLGDWLLCKCCNIAALHGRNDILVFLLDCDISDKFRSDNFTNRFLQFYKIAL